MHSKRFSIAATAALGAAAFAALPTGGSALAQGACTPATNVQAIIDDSGSMSSTDSSKLRVQALKLLINKPGNSKLILGATEFGSSAGSVFAPVPIGGASTAMQQALDARINADNGGTSYNLAFAQGKADNPGANARIFLTDGANGDTTYNNGHQGGPRTYVIGLGASLSSPTDIALLQRIASETGGTYTAVATAAGLQSTVNTIDAALSCKAISETFNDTFTKQGQQMSHKVTTKSNVTTADIVLTWTSPLDSFELKAFTYGTSGKASAAKAKKVKVVKKNGTTFATYRVSRLKKGKLKFKVKNNKLTVPGAVVTTQVTKNLKTKKKK